MLVVWKYIPRNSFIEKFDPRARWFASFLLMFAIIQYWNFNFLIIFLLISVTQLLLTKLTWKEVRRPLIFMFVLVVVIIGMNAMLSGRGGPGDLQTMTPHYYWQKAIVLPLFGWTINLSITAEKAFFAITQMTPHVVDCIDVYYHSIHDEPGNVRGYVLAAWGYPIALHFQWTSLSVLCLHWQGISR